jgi:hypothetical protein
MFSIPRNTLPVLLASTIALTLIPGNMFSTNAQNEIASTNLTTGDTLLTSGAHGPLGSFPNSSAEVLEGFEARIAKNEQERVAEIARIKLAAEEEEAAAKAAAEIAAAEIARREAAAAAASRSVTRENATPKVTTPTKTIAPKVTATTPTPMPVKSAVSKSCPLPSGDSNLQAWPRVVRSLVSEKFSPLSIGGYRAGDPRDHGKGLALDIMVPVGGSMGDSVAAWAVGNMKELNLSYVIWKQRIWLAGKSGWQSMADRGSITANHFDHVHLSFKPGSGTCPA